MTERYKTIILVLIAIIVVAIAGYFVDAYDRNSRIDSEFEHKSEQLNMVIADFATTMDTNKDWPANKIYYDKWLVTAIEMIDQQPYTIGALYEQNSGALHRITERAVDDRFSVPWEINFSSTDIYDFHAGTFMEMYEGHRIWIYYVWMPDDMPHYLFVTGVDEAIAKGGVSLTVIVFIASIFLLVIFGRKWWKGEKAISESIRKLVGGDE